MSSVVVFPEAQLLASYFIILLLTDILLYDFTIHSNGTHKVSPSPNVHSPILPSQLREFLPQPLSTLTLDFSFTVTGWS
jgi:hypothetical protein